MIAWLHRSVKDAGVPLLLSCIPAFCVARATAVRVPTIDIEVFVFRPLGLEQVPKLCQTSVKLVVLTILGPVCLLLELRKEQLTNCWGTTNRDKRFTNTGKFSKRKQVASNSICAVIKQCLGTKQSTACLGEAPLFSSVYFVPTSLYCRCLMCVCTPVIRTYNAHVWVRSYQT